MEGGWVILFAGHCKTVDSSASLLSIGAAGRWSGMHLQTRTQPCRLVGSKVALKQPGFFCLLPLDAQPKLNQPLVKCVPDGSRSGALVEVIFGQFEVCMVKCIEELRAELHPAA